MVLTFLYSSITKFTKYCISICCGLTSKAMCCFRISIIHELGIQTEAAALINAVSPSIVGSITSVGYSILLTICYWLLTNHQSWRCCRSRWVWPNPIDEFYHVLPSMTFDKLVSNKSLCDKLGPFGLKEFTSAGVVEENMYIAVPNYSKVDVISSWCVY